MAEEAEKEVEAKLPTPEELEEAQSPNPDNDETGGDPSLVVEERDYKPEAIQGGWKDEDEHTGDAPWIDAKEFVGRKPLFDAIHKLSKKNKDLDATVQNLVEHNRKIEKATYAQAVQDLKAQKIAAMDNADHAAVADIDEKIADVKAEAAAVEAAPTRTPEFTEFLENNTWYEDNEKMQRYSIRIGQEYMDKNPDAYQKDMLKHVGEVVRDAYPEEFAPPPNPKREVAPAVAAPKGGSAAGKKKDTFTESDLDHEERVVMNNMLRNSPLTKKEYLAQIAQTRS